MNQRIQSLIEAAKHHDFMCDMERQYGRLEYSDHRKTAFECRRMAREELISDAITKLPPCDTCGAVSDTFKKPTYTVPTGEVKNFTCNECGAITWLK